MKETYLQSYLIENYIFIAMVIGTFFVASMKSAVDRFLKRQLVINMSLLLILSIIEFYLDYHKNQVLIGKNFIILKLIYYSLKPLIMGIVVSVMKPKNKLIYIPAILNFLFYCSLILNNRLFSFDILNSFGSELWKYGYIVTNWIYWIILLFVLDLKFYRNTKVNPLSAFFAILWLMSANIIDAIGGKIGIMNHTYAVIFLFYYLVVHVQISQQINEEKEIKLKEQRMSLMLSQIQPHFLYNTLNTITALCRINPKLAEETTIKFSKYLRENMHNMGKNDTQLFSKELEHTNIYLDIEKLRFGDRVKVEYDIKTEDFNMPTLTLQPIVENAVKHGICNKVEGGTIKISTEKKGKDHIITISDNGIGFEMGKALNDGRTHVGIQNVKERLKTIVDAELEITSFIGIGTVVKIIIPGKKKYMRLESGKRREILSIGR